jgi:PAS domain S-box-containing protein
MNMGSFTEPIRREERNFQIVAYIVLSTMIIFYIDAITPLGLTVWILYFIPLFLTLYLPWRSAPFVTTGAFIILIGISFFLSPSDTTLLFAVSNRLFFSGLLIVSAFFIWSYEKNIESLRIHEERFRILTERSPDAIIVSHEGKIVYTNPAGLRLFAARNRGDLIGREMLDLVGPGERDVMSQKISQAMLGTPMHVPDEQLIRLDGREIRAEVSLGEVIWDGSPAVQIILRSVDTSNRTPGI